jgi:hypothetical protein
VRTVDHTGIDLIARDPNSPEVIGISVERRSRYEGTENESVNLPQDGFDKARRACEAFGCVPYYAIVVDGINGIRCFLLPLAHLERTAIGSAHGMRYWQMSERSLPQYRADPLMRGFELRIEACSWRDNAT